MSISVIGFNHRSAPIEIRERFAFESEELALLLSRLKAQTEVEELVILNTCNRVEVYMDSRQPFQPGFLFRLIAQFRDKDRSINWDLLESSLYMHQGEGCIEHLIRVASGLDSMVLGETEILGQVKIAYQNALSLGTTGKTLNRLFQKAFSIVKQLRTNTEIGRCSTSVGSVAVDLVSQLFGSKLTECRAMIIGAGNVAETTLKHLTKNGVTSVIVANRSFESAASLANEFNGVAVPWEKFYESIATVDVIISSTGAPFPILKKTHFMNALSHRNSGAKFLIDLAMPRDIDESVREIPNVYLFNLDQLGAVAQKNLEKRQKEAASCESLIREHASKVQVLLSQNRAIPTQKAGSIKTPFWETRVTPTFEREVA
jgi:glutamyl-tRNA reductase